MSKEDQARQLLLNYFDNMREKIVFYRFVPGGIVFLTVNYGVIHDITAVLSRVTADPYLESYNIIPANHGDVEAALAMIGRLSIKLYGNDRAITFSQINPDNPSKMESPASGVFKG